MRVLFWGTPEFATPPLRALIGEGFDVVGVVTAAPLPRCLAGIATFRRRHGLLSVQLVTCLIATVSAVRFPSIGSLRFGAYGLWA